MSNSQQIQAATAHFGKLVAEQLERVERLKQEGDWVDYTSVEPIVIGMIAGDGIGPSNQRGEPAGARVPATRPGGLG